MSSTSFDGEQLWWDTDANKFEANLLFAQPCAVFRNHLQCVLSAFHFGAMQPTTSVLLFFTLLQTTVDNLPVTLFFNAIGFSELHAGGARHCAQHDSDPV